ncbi:hypothetical protein AB4K20DRAFT_1886915 [Rhizopus microsporus]
MRLLYILKDCTRKIVFYLHVLLFWGIYFNTLLILSFFAYQLRSNSFFLCIHLSHSLYSSIFFLLFPRSSFSFFSFLFF